METFQTQSQDTPEQELEPHSNESNELGRTALTPELEDERFEIVESIAWGD